MSDVEVRTADRWGVTAGDRGSWVVTSPTGRTRLAIRDRVAALDFASRMAAIDVMLARVCGAEARLLLKLRRVSI